MGPKSKSFFQIFIIIIASLTIPYFSEDVEAVENTCCEKTISGESCQYTDSLECNPEFNQANIECSQTQFCGNVCCYQENSGVCSRNVPLSTCINSGGSVIQDASCNVPQCEVGCCEIGNSYRLTTEQQCQSLTSSYPSLEGVDNFNENIQNEQICLEQGRLQDEGCCIGDAGTCSFTSRELCGSSNLDANNGKEGFYKNTYCSSEILTACSECQPQAKKGCFDDNVYWLDSCGNRENIAEDCGSDSICTEENGNAFCRSFNCETTQSYSNNPHDPKIEAGATRKNGESWCVYESPVGDFKDYPGTRHYKHYCFEGEEYVEPCRDFREEICLQGEYTNSNGESVSNSQCLENSFYSENEGQIPVNISTVPLGSNFWESYNPEERNSPNRETIEVCADGNSKCKITYARSSHFDDWECVSNCQCEKRETIDKMALFCKAQGDCGADFNVEQEMSTAGLKIKWTGTSEGPRIKKLKNSFWNKIDDYGVFGGMQALVDAHKQLLSLRVDTEKGFSYGSRFNPSFYTEYTKDLTKTFGPGGFGLSIYISFVRFIFGRLTSGLIGSDTATKTIKVVCKPYVPPLGGDNCGECGEDPLHPCTEYKCRSLGTSCELINEGTSQVECVDSNPNDVNAPVISPWQEGITQGYAASVTPKGYLITPEIEPFTPITIAIQTDEPALCNYDSKHTASFDDMEEEFDSLFSTKHSVRLSLPNGDTYNYYIRCKDTKGNTNIEEYEIIIITKEGPDFGPPAIIYTSISNGAFIPYNTNETDLAIYMDEESSCKWDSADIDYDSMKNGFVCDTLEGPTEFDNYECGTQLTGLKNENNNFYFRCRDRNNNTNSQSYVFTLKGTQTPLKIDSSSPKDTIFTQNTALQVSTSGGAENGNAVCAFSTNKLAYAEFFSSGGKTHSQNLESLQLGTYRYFIACTDAAGNEAEGEINFAVNVDKLYPKIKYIYKDTSSVHIVLDEPATCEYLPEPFAYGSGLKAGELTVEHTIPVSENQVYVICQDKDNNKSPVIKIVL